MKPGRSRRGGRPFELRSLEYAESSDGLRRLARTTRVPLGRGPRAQERTDEELCLSCIRNSFEHDRPPFSRSGHVSIDGLSISRLFRHVKSQVQLGMPQVDRDPFVV